MSLKGEREQCVITNIIIIIKKPSYDNTLLKKEKMRAEAHIMTKLTPLPFY